MYSTHDGDQRMMFDVLLKKPVVLRDIKLSLMSQTMTFKQ